MNNLVIEKNIVKKFTGTDGETVTIPEGVVEIARGAFDAFCQNKQGPQKVIIPKTVTKIGEYAFRWCKGLMEVVLKDGVTEIGNGAFDGCEKLKKINLPATIKNIGSGAFCDCKTMKSMTIPEGVLTISEKCFSNCWNLGSIILPSTLYSIGEYAFEGCLKLSEIDLPHNVVSIGKGAFKGSGLTDIVVNKKITTIECETYEQTEIKNVVIPDSIISIESSAFAICNNLKEIIIPNSVKMLGKDVFSNSQNLKVVKLTNQITSIPAKAFRGCKSLEEIVVPNNVEEICSSAFMGCEKLKKVLLPKKLKAVGDSCFYGCSSLVEIDFPKGVHYGEDALFGCSKLHKNDLLIIENILCGYTGESDIFEIPEGVVDISESLYGFHGRAKNIECIKLPQSMTLIDFNKVEKVKQIEFFDSSSIKKNPLLLIDETTDYSKYYSQTSHVLIVKREDGSIKWKMYIGLEGEVSSNRKKILETLLDKRDKIDILNFDKCFSDVKVHYNKALMAMYRLQYPNDLSEDARIMYESYLKKNGIKAISDFIDTGYLEGIIDINKYDVINAKNIDKVLDLANAEGNKKIISYLTKYIREKFPTSASIKKTTKSEKDLIWKYTKVGKIVEFGTFVTKGKKTKLKWRILDVKNDRMLMIAEQPIGEGIYDENNDRRWKQCSLRKWLNKDFLNEAFTNSEKKLIVPVENKTPFYGDSSTVIGTKDTIFLLSEKEAKKYIKIIEHFCFSDFYDGYLREGLLIKDSGYVVKDIREYGVRRPASTYKSLIRPAICVKIIQ